MFSLLFIDRPVLAKVISILLVIVGLIALKLLPVAQFPQIVPPVVQVQANYAGGSAATVEKLLTAPIEDQLNGTEHMLYMESTSASDGTSTIKVYFEPGTDLDTASIDVQNRVSIAMPALPAEVKQRGVTTKKLSSSMLEILSVTSDNPEHDALYLSNFAALNVVEELKRVPGVSNVIILGEHRFAMRIWLDPDKMAAKGITIADVRRAIAAQNLQISLGSLGDRAASDQNPYQYTIIAKTRLEKPEEFERIVLREDKEGKAVYLRDVARIELGSENYVASASMNNRPSVQLGIFQLPDANALDVADKISAKIKELSRRFPKGVHIRPGYDTTKFVKVSIEEVLHTLFEALVLVLAVVFVFLQSWRATLIPAIAIPVSLVGTFAFLYLADFSINLLTLFGLILAIGIVVDDAILVVENVEANLEKNPDISLKEATKQAMREIFGPVIATTLVLLAVFVPVAFIPGISGALYRQFAMTIAFSVLISALVALTLSPALAATMLRRTSKEPGGLFKLFNAALEKTKTGYAAMLRGLIRYRYVVLMVYALLLAATWYVFRTVPTGFLPEEDQGTLIASASLRPGTTLSRTKEASRKLTELIRQTPGVEDVIAINGYNTLTGTVDSSAISLYIILKDWDERTDVNTSVPYLTQTLQKRIAREIPEVQARIFGAPSIPGLSATGGFEFKLLNLASMPFESFVKTAQDFIAKLPSDPRIAAAYTMFRDDYPQIVVDIDRDKVHALGLSIDAVFGILQTYLGTYYVNDFNKFGKTYRVFLQADPAHRMRLRDIETFLVRNAQGKPVPFGAFAHLRKQAGANILTHFNGYQAITVNGMHAIGAGYSSSDALQAIEEAAAKLPSGVGIAFAGTSLQEKQAGNAATYIFMLSLLMVYLILAAQYESWIVPLMIMLPIPVVMLGALGSNALAGLINDTYTQIGLVLLIAMASKNAILVVEFAKELRESGKGIVESAVEAAVLRMRAILMTAFAFLLGLLPLLFATGAGAASRHSLGTAVFGGMAVSTLLTFLLTPVLFVVLQRIKEFRRAD